MYLAQGKLSFTDFVLTELHHIEDGNDFLTECNSVLEISDIMDILAYCDQGTIDRIIETDQMKRVFLTSKEVNTYFFIANAAVYNTLDMDATLDWFEKTLEWRGEIEARDETGNGTYGMIHLNVNVAPRENRDPYMQLMRGEPTKSFAGFINVWGLEDLRKKIINNGWQEVSPIQEMPWGANLFVATTCDGSLIRFFEPADFRN